MLSYEATLKAGDTRMVLSPDSEFFRYLRNPSGVDRPAKTAPAN
jgi:membrane protease subunit HflC